MQTGFEKSGGSVGRNALARALCLVRSATRRAAWLPQLALDGNARGEIRFLLEDAGPATYYLYFDITENGAKPVNPPSPDSGGYDAAVTSVRIAPTGPFLAPSGGDNPGFNLELRVRVQ